MAKSHSQRNSPFISKRTIFWVNEKFVGSATDRDMTEGQVGFSLTTLDLKGARVEFEYLYAEPE